jgi:signal transduction histidine kinase
VPHGSIMNDEALPGVGIAGMRERVTLLNGTFELESAPGVGTTVRAILPVTPVRTPQDAKVRHRASSSLPRAGGRAQRTRSQE